MQAFYYLPLSVFKLTYLEQNNKFATITQNISLHLSFY